MSTAMPVAGSPAPDFTLPATDGQTVTLSALRGRPVVLYFYPKDDTPGCTTEACDFRDRQSVWDGELGAAVFGISADSLKAHDKFRAKYNLPFPLLSDPDKAMISTYGAFGKKMMYGKETQGIIRSTFLIDKDGVIARVWPKVAVKGHADEVLAALAALR
jgi:peroxiredoxin Q/BCP